MNVDTIRAFALSLDGVTEAPHHQFSSFRVGGNIFVTIAPCGQLIHVFVDEPTREMALGVYGEFIEKLLWGGKVVGLRVHLNAATLDVVHSLMLNAYQLRVSKNTHPKKRAPV
jgi:hypothetical protein